MIEKLFLVSILVFFILAFGVKNIKTYFSTRQSIRGSSMKLTLSVVLSTIIYLLIFLRITVLDPSWILEPTTGKNYFLKFPGYALVILGFIIGIFALISMKNSWRVGIKYDQKTELITSGIYKFSRNPFFLSYDILILGYVLIFPSIILFALLLLLSVVFHTMILEEEKYLFTVHGEKYNEYKNKVNRYLTL